MISDSKQEENHPLRMAFYRVGEGARTLNRLIHSQVLCQLSYTHHGF